MVNIQFPFGSFHYLDAPIREFLRRPVRFPRHGIQQLLIVQENPDTFHVEINEGINIVTGRKNPQNSGTFICFSSPANRLFVYQ